MKYLIIGDLHFVDLSKFIDLFEKENPDILLCTGDFDSVKTIRQYIELEEEYLNKGRKVFTVPGNHDYYVLNYIPFKSKKILREGDNVEILNKKLKEDPIAYEYLDKLVNGFKITKDPYDFGSINFYLDENKYLDDFYVKLIHATPTGNPTLAHFDNSAPEPLLGRLLTKEDYLNNLRMMRTKGENIMIRGHDHEQVYAVMNFAKQMKTFYNNKNHSRFELSEFDYHCITHGALSEGKFATIDTDYKNKELPILTFHKVNMK